jgi:hypothetical protein
MRAGTVPETGVRGSEAWQGSGDGPVSGTDAALTAGGTLLPVMTALASACGFALSTSLQHRVAGAVPRSVRGPLGILRRLVTRPAWVAGVLVGFVSLVLHAIALDLGSIAVVQPLMVAGVVLAVPVRAALDRRRPSAHELAAVTVAATGLAAFVVVAEPRPGTVRVAEGTIALLVLGGIALAGAIAVVSGVATRADGRERGWSLTWALAWSRAVWLGVGSGVLFGITAGMLKLIARDVDTDGVAAAASGWHLWGLIGAGVLGLTLNQYAYQAAPLSASMPVVNVVDVVVALGFGWVVFGEVPAHGSVSLLVQAGALVCVAVGLWGIARSYVPRHAGPRRDRPSLTVGGP